MPNEITLTPKGERWRRTGHPWIYKDDCAPSSGAVPGQIVRVKSAQGRLLGQAFYNPASKITLRWLTDQTDQLVDAAFWAARLEKALELRRRVVVEQDTAYRLIYAEADGFPGLVADRYGPVVVLQSLSLGMEALLPLMVELIQGALHPGAVVLRNDVGVRTLEGLEPEKRLLTGEQPGLVEVTEAGRRTLVDVWEGQKTGAYLDQRENHPWAASYARGRVLDAFAYQGGFSLQVAERAEEVLAIEDSAAALKRLEENLKRNRLTQVKAERGNVFERLRRLEQDGARFDLIILDPPAFAKNRSEVSNASRGYREINLRALKLLQPGGRLITCSCSYLIRDEIFLEILRIAACDAGRSVRLLEVRTQARDHPILLTHPEGRYLKCVALEVE